MSLPWMQSYPTEEIADFQECTCEEIGFIMQMRWYAWRNHGVPTDETFLRNFAKRRGISKYKLTKILPCVENFFQKVGACFVYLPDEERRAENEEKSAKNKESGKKGADSRWKTSAKQQAPTPVPAIAWLSETDGISASESETPIETAAAFVNPVVGAAAAEKRSQETQNEGERRGGPELVTRQDRVLAAQKLIAERFPDVSEAFVDDLHRLALQARPELTDGEFLSAIRQTYKGREQETAGLWLHTVPAYLKNLNRRPMAVEKQSHPEYTGCIPGKEKELAEFLAKKKAMHG